jgi:diguanylate cyclase (GGDEF)-like protein
MPVALPKINIRPFWPGSIRTRLLLLVLVAVLPMAASRLWALQEAAAHRVTLVQQKASEIARQGEVLSSDVIDDARATLSVLAHVDSVASDTGAACNTLLAQLLTGKPWAAGFFALNTQGTVICSSAAENLGLNILDRDYVKDAITSRKFNAGDFIIGRKSMVPMIGSAMPIYDKQGVLKRILVATVTASWFDRLAAEVAGANPGSTVTLIDGKGIVLAHAPMGAEKTGQLVGTSDMREALSNKTGRAFTAPGADGVVRLFAYTTLPQMSARLVVGLSRDGIVDDAARTRNAAILEIACVSFALLAMMWWLASATLAGPIQSLVRRAEIMGQGHFEARVTPRHWPSDLGILSDSMNQMAAQIAMHHAQLAEAHDKLRDEALLDHLTDLPNRRAFQSALNTCWNTAITTNRSAALIMIDADNFKGFNDTYGHVAGDAALIQLAGVLRKSCDGLGMTPARLGGEEFAVLVPFQSEDHVIAVAEGIRQSVENLMIEHCKSAHGHFTVSLGVANIQPGHDASKQDLMRAADAALYGAKMAGRNKVMSAGRMRELVPALANPAAATMPSPVATDQRLAG